MSDAPTPTASEPPTPELTAAVTGEHTTDGRPNGSSSITPFVTVNRAREAIRFYEKVFGARVVDVTEMPGEDGTPVVAHAVLDFGVGQLQLGEPMPAYGLVPPSADDSTCVSLAVYVRDTDATVAAAVAEGATVREAPMTFVSGDRFASVKDPFGLRWSVMTRVEDLSEQESVERVRKWAASMSG